MGERHTEEMRLLGLTIAFYRRARGLTQSELAEAVQISRTHMSNIEAPNSHTSLSLNKLMDIAEALEIPLKTLLLPKDFASLNISKVIWQRYIFVLTIPIKSSFSHKE